MLVLRYRILQRFKSESQSLVQFTQTASEASLLSAPGRCAETLETGGLCLADAPMRDSLALVRKPSRLAGFAVSVGLACIVFYLLPQRKFEGQDLNGQWFSTSPSCHRQALFFRNLVVALTAAF